MLLGVEERRNHWKNLCLIWALGNIVTRDNTANDIKILANKFTGTLAK